ncbi:MAG: TVP38/TMEM64 family protein [Alphaproteobacteria bacterium]
MQDLTENENNAHGHNLGHTLDQTRDQTRDRNGLMRRVLPLIILGAGLGAFFALGFERYLSIETLSAHRGDLLAFVAEFGVVAVLAFMACYAAAIAFSVPGGALMTITAGFLFGTTLGTVYVVIAATIGSTALFLAARTALGDALRRRAGPALQKMEAGFQANALSYLLFLRLIPVFPFWLVNLVPAFLGVPLRTYVTGTFFGIIPGTFVYASVGTGLGAVLASGKTPDLGVFFTPAVLIPIAGLAVLALLPVLGKRYFPRFFTRLSNRAGDDSEPTANL